jgi:ArsR family transcriptional regulator, arsenate/arsenite/antimonite-responsive transcriptional repressor
MIPAAPPIAPSLTQAGPQKLAARLKAIADPTRLHMLDLLSQQSEPLCVCDITDEFEQNQPTISHRLKLLREAGLREAGLREAGSVDCKKRGIRVFYWATDEGRASLAAMTGLVK